LFDCDQGCGIVFKLDAAGRFTVLQRFTGNCYYGRVNYSGTIFKLEP